MSLLHPASMRRLPRSRYQVQDETANLVSARWDRHTKSPRFQKDSMRRVHVWLEGIVGPHRWTSAILNSGRKCVGRSLRKCNRDQDGLVDWLQLPVDQKPPIHRLRGARRNQRQAEESGEEEQSESGHAVGARWGRREPYLLSFFIMQLEWRW